MSLFVCELVIMDSQAYENRFSVTNPRVLLTDVLPVFRVIILHPSFGGLGQGSMIMRGQGAMIMRI